MPTLIKCPKAQAMVETAFAVPVLLLLFAGCVQLMQIGIAHIVVMEAAYEAGRQAYMDDNSAGAQRVAEEICRTISSGATDYDGSTRTVTHHLHAFFPVLKNIRIAHSTPQGLFYTDETPRDNP